MNNTSNIKLYKHQADELEATKNMNKVAYYHDMGLGKTFTGAEKLIQLGTKVNLVICQKSKIDDWYYHFKNNYEKVRVFDLTSKTKTNKTFRENALQNAINNLNCTSEFPYVFIINYELAFRRPELLKLTDFTLMLDESSMIQNETAKRSKFIMKLNFKNLILLSGTPTAGRYERLWSQLHLLGWNISKDLFWKQYVDVEYLDNQGFPIKVVRGYKNVERLKQKMRDYGCKFLKTDEVFDLPEQIFNTIRIDTTKEYRRFKKDRIITVEDKDFHDPLLDDDIRVGKQLVGDTTLTKMLYERMLCGSYNPNKLEALKDLLQSSDDRIIIFYNFNEELKELENICLELDKPMSWVNGKEKDLTMYEAYSDSVTLIQYQAGAMGLNLQKANKIVYFTPTLSSELFEQSKKRIHRIGQNSSCFYYMLTCKNSIEEKIYKTLEMRKDYTDKLFEEDEQC